MAKFAKEMKCPFCKSKAFLEQKETPLLNGLLVLKKDFFYKCSKCKEDFSTAEQVKAVSDELKKAFYFNRQVISTGGSLGITFPADLSDYYNLHKGEKVQLIPESRQEIKIRVTR